jgi:hypothetical protein
VDARALERGVQRPIAGALGIVRGLQAMLQASFGVAFVVVGSQQQLRKGGPPLVAERGELPDEPAQRLRLGRPLGWGACRIALGRREPPLAAKPLLVRRRRRARPVQHHLEPSADGGALDLDPQRVASRPRLRPGDRLDDLPTGASSTSRTTAPAGSRRTAATSAPS